MSLREKMYWSRPEDYIQGLDNIGKYPKMANKMLCFVVHGLSTKYNIPAGYFFHAALTSGNFYTLTMNVMLKLLTDCGFIVLRLVTDNFSSNVTLFKKLSGGPPKNYYVLTRSFSSDAVQAMFSHVRLRGGSNDATDARAADYALRQILRCGIIKASNQS